MMSYYEAAEKNSTADLRRLRLGSLNSMNQNADNEYEVFGMCRSPQDGTVYRSYGTKIGGVLSVCYRHFTAATGSRR